MVATTVPSTTPNVYVRPSTPDTTPYWLSGTVSGATACAALIDAAMASWNTDQPMVSATKPGAAPMNISAPAAASPPKRIHGARRPHREFVRSDSQPASGCPMMEKNPPMAMSSASFCSFSPGCHTRICCASNSCVGAAHEMFWPR